MYNEAHEFGFEETPFFSDTLDILIEWGYLCFFGKHKGERASLLLDRFEKRSQERDFEKDLLDGACRLEEAVKKALELLHGDPKILVAPHEDSISEIQSALSILDQVVFLNEALEEFPLAGKLTRDIEDAANRLLDLVTVERRPPFLRLVCMNQWRKEILQRIPEEKRHLVPWYEDGVEFPEDILETIIQHWGNLGVIGQKPPELDEVLWALLLFELKADPELEKYVMEESAFHSALLKAIGGDQALELLILGDEEALRRAVSPVVEKVGLDKAAWRAIAGGHLRGEKRVEALFLGALCGPNLEFHQRYEILSEVLQDPWTKEAWHTSLRNLALWLGGQGRAEDIVRKAFDEWTERLDKAAWEILDKPSLAEEAVPVWDSLQSLRKEPSPLKDVALGLARLPKKAQESAERVLKSIVPWIQEHLPHSLAPGLALVYASPDAVQIKEEEKEEESAKPRSFSGAWCLALKMESATGRYVLLDADPDAGEEFERLREFLRKRKFYWSAWFVNEKGEITDPIEVQCAKRIPLFVSPPSTGEWPFIIMAVGTEMEILEGIINRIEQGKEPSEAARRVLWLFYVKP